MLPDHTPVDHARAGQEAGPVPMTVSLDSAAEEAPQPEQTSPGGRLRATVAGFVAEVKSLPEAVHSPATVRERARSGEYTTVKPGERSALRGVNTAWAKVVATPVTWVLMPVVWLFQSLARFLVGVPVIFAVATAVAQIPLVGLLIPDWLNVAAWLGW
ncbi:hypothetical protein MOQ72_43755 [Saccharopolyspora sp. K220]|uniref:hypothetical protein n=1 Tax=Saccharopolyspora soli TaxID=2926618 RepID=UPI001F5AC7D9|nr:hypothetical protein [Saccharopolyspora soli]MCI2424328.1 hypothetical protein [Saccharopolyspora soli]